MNYWCCERRGVSQIDALFGIVRVRRYPYGIQICCVAQYRSRAQKGVLKTLISVPFINNFDVGQGGPSAEDRFGCGGVAILNPYRPITCIVCMQHHVIVISF